MHHFLLCLAFFAAGWARPTPKGLMKAIGFIKSKL